MRRISVAAIALSLLATGFVAGRALDEPGVPAPRPDAPTPAPTLTPRISDALAILDSEVSERPDEFDLAFGEAGLWLNSGDLLQSVHPMTLQPSLFGGILAGDPRKAILDVAVDAEIWILHANPETGAVAVSHVLPSFKPVLTVPLPNRGIPARDLPMAMSADAVYAITGTEADGLLVKVDRQSGRVVETTSLEFWTNLSVGEGAVWVTRDPRDKSELLSIDPTTLNVRWRRQLPPESANVLAAGRGSVWVGGNSSTGRSFLLQIDPEDGHIEKPHQLEGGLFALASGPGGIWMIEGGSVMRLRWLDAQGRLAEGIAFPMRGGFELAVGKDAVWVSSTFEAILFRVSA